MRVGAEVADRDGTVPVSDSIGEAVDRTATSAEGAGTLSSLPALFVTSNTAPKLVPKRRRITTAIIATIKTGRPSSFCCIVTFSPNLPVPCIVFSNTFAKLEAM